MASHPDLQVDEFDSDSDIDMEPYLRRTVPQRTSSDLELQVQDLKGEVERLRGVYKTP